MYELRHRLLFKFLCWFLAARLFQRVRRAANHGIGCDVPPFGTRKTAMVDLGEPVSMILGQRENGREDVFVVDMVVRAMGADLRWQISARGTHPRDGER